ncbi:MAG: hypothetical protein ACTSX7_07795 [Alphaproteobacteria bacterium]
MIDQDWRKVGQIIAKFAPMAGFILGQPIIGNVVGSVLSTALGVAAVPNAVIKAIKADPKAETKLRAFEKQHGATFAPLAVSGDFGQAYAQEGADLKFLPGWLKALAIFARVIWRPVAAITFTASIATIVWRIAAAMSAGNIDVMLAATNLMGTLGFTTLLGGMFGVMGVYVHGRNKLQQKRAEED